MTEAFKITGELTQDPTVCKFHCDCEIVDDWTLTFESPSESKGSPLIDALFEVEGIVGVMVTQSTVVITKDDPMPWPQFAAPVAKAIRATCGKDTPPIAQEVIDDLMSRPMDEAESSIRELFETNINPALASHGGYVKLLRVEDRDVYVEMGGGCQGCSSARATLRYGVEGAIRRVAPQVRHIVDATDHAAGTNPYFT